MSILRPFLTPNRAGLGFFNTLLDEALWRRILERSPRHAATVGDERHSHEAEKKNVRPSVVRC